MVLDVVLFRADKGGNPNMVRESQRRRYKPVELVDEIIAADNEWLAARHELDSTNASKNALSKEFGKAKKSGGDVEALRKQSTELDARVEALEAKLKELEAKRYALLNRVGNIVHESVPVHNDEEHNGVYRTWGTPGAPLANPKTVHEHDQLLVMIGGVDMVRGTKVAGHRGYILKGMGERLNQAIMSYACDFLTKRGYTLMHTPAFMRRDLMSKTAQLEDFDEMLYKVGEVQDATAAAAVSDDAKYLIATSEQPLSAIHAGEWLDPKELPIRYAGLSECFRMEAGAAGRDVRGIFRVHQFQKVEQFCITTPEESWAEHERMLEAAEAFYQTLDLPYQVVAIVSGALNNAAAKKYDVECWFPGQKKFRELVSCSNCTDYQSRSLEVRCGAKKAGDKEKKYVHMLNSTLAPNTRTICCVLERYQTDTGVVVPEVLRPYLGGVDFLPFVAPAPVHTETK